MYEKHVTVTPSPSLLHEKKAVDAPARVSGLWNSAPLPLVVRGTLTNPVPWLVHRLGAPVGRGAVVSPLNRCSA